MLKIDAIGCIALADATRAEPSRHVVFGDPDLIVAVGQVRRVDQLQLVGEILPDGQSCTRVGLVGDDGWLNANFAQSGCLTQPPAECRSDPAGHIREHLLARHFVLFPAHLVERAAGHEHGHDVRLRQRRVRSQRRLRITGRTGHGNGDVVIARPCTELQIE